MRDAISTSDARQFVRGFRELLTADEERELFQAWWDTNPKAFAALLDPDNTEANRFIGGDDNTYLTRIVLKYSPVIRRAIKELSSYKMDEDELLSEGLIALAEAARRYAPSAHEDVRFAAYAKVCVKGMMQGYIMKHFFPVQFTTNRAKKRLFYAMRKHIAIEMRETGTFKMTPAVVAQLSQEFDVDEQDVWLMYNMFKRPSESIDQPVAFSDEGEDVYSLGDTLQATDMGTEQAVFEVNEVQFHRRLLDRAMESLTHREKTVFVAQVLSEKENVRTLEDLAREFDLSKERVRQIRNEAAKKVERAVRRITDEHSLEAADLFST